MYSDAGGIGVPTSKDLSGGKSSAYGKTAFELKHREFIIFVWVFDLFDFGLPSDLIVQGHILFFCRKHARERG